MRSFVFGIIGLVIIGASAPASAQQTYDLNLLATGPSNPPTGTGSFTIDALPPGANLTGLFLQGPPGSGTSGNELTSMSFDFAGEIFDFSTEVVPGSATVLFDSSGNLSRIGYLGTDGHGDTLTINNLDYFVSGPNLNSLGTITAAVPEPASMALITAALVGMVAVRRRRRS
jgi:hypothetical protein